MRHSLVADLLPSAGTSTVEPIRIGISTCLLGEKVRHDGGHKHDRLLAETLGKCVEWVPVCPEVEIGMGIPREPIQLAQGYCGIHLVGVRSETDHTDAMRAYARRRVGQLAGENLSGFILKQDSPSCGLERVRVHRNRKPPIRSGRGLFAAALAERLPNLPIIEEERIHDPRCREKWVERVCAYHRLQSLWATRWRIHDLARFHAAHKLALLAHVPQSYEQLGRLIARAKARSRSALREQYERGFMMIFSVLATRSRHTAVLRRALGDFGDRLGSVPRRDLLDRIDAYRRGLVPLIVPISLVAHYTRVCDVDALKDQVYLNPHSNELALRISCMTS